MVEKAVRAVRFCCQVTSITRRRDNQQLQPDHNSETKLFEGINQLHIFSQVGAGCFSTLLSASHRKSLSENPIKREIGRSNPSKTQMFHNTRQFCLNLLQIFSWLKGLFVFYGCACKRFTLRQKS